MADRPGFFRRFFGGLWSFLNFTRQLIFNVLFLRDRRSVVGGVVCRGWAGCSWT